MEPIKCEMCGSNDIVKSDGLYVCRHCGTKYTVEEARNLFYASETAKLENLYSLARRHADTKDYNSARQYYKEILLIDANNWEPIFFASYYTVCCSNYNSIDKNLKDFVNMFPHVLDAITDESCEGNLRQVADKTSLLASLLFNSFANTYNDPAVNKYYTAERLEFNDHYLTVDAHVLADMLYNLGDSIDARWQGMFKSIVCRLWDQANLYSREGGCNRSKIAHYEKKIALYDCTDLVRNKIIADKEHEILQNEIKRKKNDTRAQIIMYVIMTLAFFLLMWTCNRCLS